LRKLIVNDGRRERELVLVGRIVVGRDPICDVSEADPLLSRRHAEFTTDGNTIVARDLGSRNGIYVNGARVAEQRLRSGDVIQIGHLKVRYVEDSAPLVAAPELADVDATAVIHRTSRESAPALPNSPAAVRPVPPPSPKPMPPPAASPDDDRTFVVAPPAPKPAARSGSISGSAAGIAPRSTPAAASDPPGPARSVDSNETRVVSPPESRAGAPASALKLPDVPIDPSSQTVVITRTAAKTAPTSRTAATVDPRQVRAMSIAVEAIASFLVTAWTTPAAARAVKALEADLALLADGKRDALTGSSGIVAPANGLANALNTLVARLRAATDELK